MSKTEKEAVNEFLMYAEQLKQAIQGLDNEATNLKNRCAGFLDRLSQSSATLAEWPTEIKNAAAALLSTTVTANTKTAVETLQTALDAFLTARG